MKYRGVVLFALSALFINITKLPLSAQTTGEPYWLLLERGKQYYRTMEYGKALIAFEDAKRTRNELYLKMQKDFIEFLSADEVRVLGDSISKISLYLKDRPNKRISDILAEIQYHFPESVIQDSAQKIISLFDILRLYPEAEYWIGEVYREEGEATIALQQYTRALSQQRIVGSDDFTIQIEYKIVEMYHILGNYPQYEKTLIDIVSQDSLWNGDSRSQSFIKTAMFRTLTDDGINRFLTLYRHDNTQIERAHRLLGFYYYVTGRYDKSIEHLTFAFLIQNSMLIKEYQLRVYGYTFKDYMDLINKLVRFSDLETYMQDVDYYKTNYYLAAALFATGRRSTAMYIWTVLSKNPRASEWQKRSQMQLKKPYIEPINERP
jgi:tetratricopeptide (TPR) repeat protein